MKLKGDEDLLVEKLFEQKLIGSYMFSFFLNRENKESYIYFGGYEESYGEFEWMPMDQDKLNHWNVYFKWVFLKGERGIDVNKIEAVIDSGTTLMYFSQNIFETLIESLISNISSCEQQQDLVLCASSVDLPNIYFHISTDHSYELTPNDYTYNLDTETLLIGISYLSETSEFLLLGDTFMRGHYIVHDAEEYRMGL